MKNPLFFTVHTIHIIAFKNNMLYPFRLRYYIHAAVTDQVTLSHTQSHSVTHSLSYLGQRSAVLFGRSKVCRGVPSEEQSHIRALCFHSSKLIFSHNDKHCVTLTSPSLYTGLYTPLCPFPHSWWLCALLNMRALGRRGENCSTKWRGIRENYRQFHISRLE